MSARLGSMDIAQFSNLEFRLEWLFHSTFQYSQNDGMPLDWKLEIQLKTVQFPSTMDCAISFSLITIARLSVNKKSLQTKNLEQSRTLP